MRKYLIGFLSALCLCFIFAGIASANEKTGTVKKEKHARAVEKCPECDQAIAKLNAKKDEIKAVHDKIKALHEAQKAKREAERKARLEELKQKDPKRYEEVVAKAAEHKKHHKKMKKECPKHGEHPKGKDAGCLKEKNPEMYELVLQKQKLHEEMKTIHDELKDCKKVHVTEHHKEKIAEKSEGYKKKDAGKAKD